MLYLFTRFCSIFFVFFLLFNIQTNVGSLDSKEINERLSQASSQRSLGSKIRSGCAYYLTCGCCCRPLREDVARNNAIELEIRSAKTNDENGTGNTFFQKMENFFRISEALKSRSNYTLGRIEQCQEVQAFLDDELKDEQVSLLQITLEGFLKKKEDELEKTLARQTKDIEEHDEQFLNMRQASKRLFTHNISQPATKKSGIMAYDV